MLFTIDRARYALALSSARSNLAKLKVDADNTRQRYQRRRDLKQYVSTEERNDAEFTYRAAQAAVTQAEVAVSQAQLDLERAIVKAPVDGYITNLLLRPGQYVNAGAETLTLVDANSFYVQGYFEETKLSHIHPGDPAGRSASHGHHAARAGSGGLAVAPSAPPHGVLDRGGGPG